MTDVMQRVQAGYEWILSAEGVANGLDLDRVDLDTLEMNHKSRCVLGQAYEKVDPEEYAGYTTVLNRVCIARGWRCGDSEFDPGTYWQREAWAVEHGFTAESCEWGALEVEWRRVIGAARQREAMGS